MKGKVWVFIHSLSSLAFVISVVHYPYFSFPVVVLLCSLVGVGAISLVPSYRRLPCKFQSF